METPPPKSIRTIGLVLACIGGFLFLSNSLSFLIIGVFDLPGRFLRGMPAGTEPPFDVLPFIRAMVPLTGVSAGLGLALAIGGLYVRRYRRWALLLVNVTLLAYIVLLWYLPSYLMPYMEELLQAMPQMDPAIRMPRFDNFALIGQYFNALLWSVALGAVGYLLNRKKYRAFFN